jgi:hypothetical protein
MCFNSYMIVKVGSSFTIPLWLVILAHLNCSLSTLTLKQFLWADDHCHCYWRCQERSQNIEFFDRPQQPSAILWLLWGRGECIYSYGVSSLVPSPTTVLYWSMKLIIKCSKKNYKLSLGFIAPNKHDEPFYLLFYVKEHIMLCRRSIGQYPKKIWNII